MAAALPAIISAAGSIGGGYLAGKTSGSETKTQRQQRKLIDELLSSLSGGGAYSSLYNPSYEAFQKSFVEPAQATFRNQIAPQIQQQYIASGQQRGTGLDDQLLRAGVDLNSILNEKYMDFYQGAQNRQQNTIGSILGGGPGGSQGMGSGQALGQGISGYLSGDAFRNTITDIFKGKAPQSNEPAKRGFQS